jgi:hypothetical protein
MREFGKDISAAKSQAYQSVASMKYQTNVNPDMSQQFAGMLEAAKSMKASAVTTEKNTNEELIASNVMMAKKMDDLIDLMRSSVGYQQKISQQVYA